MPGTSHDLETFKKKKKTRVVLLVFFRFEGRIREEFINCNRCTKESGKEKEEEEKERKDDRDLNDQ